MATRLNDYAKGVKPMPIARADELIEVVLPVSLTANPSVSDIDVAGYIPEDHVPVDWFVTSDDMDTNGTPTIVFSVGALLADNTDLDTTARGGGAAWATGSTIAQTGGFLRNAAKNCAATPPLATSKLAVGFKWTAASATFAAGTIYLHLFYRAASYGK